MSDRPAWAYRTDGHEREALPHVIAVWQHAGAKVEKVGYERFGADSKIPLYHGDWHPAVRLLKHWPDLRVTLPSGTWLLCEVKGKPLRPTGNLAIEGASRWACVQAARLTYHRCLVIWQRYDGAYVGCDADEIQPHRQLELRPEGPGSSGQPAELISENAPYLRALGPWVQALCGSGALAFAQ